MATGSPVDGETMSDKHFRALERTVLAGAVFAAYTVTVIGGILVESRGTSAVLLGTALCYLWVCGALMGPGICRAGWNATFGRLHDNLAIETFHLPQPAEERGENA